jgi:hypothetical protein
MGIRHLHLSAKLLGPFAHASDTDARVSASHFYDSVHYPFAVIPHLHNHLAISLNQVNPGFARTRMAEDVCKGFLNDAENRSLQFE